MSYWIGEGISPSVKGHQEVNVNDPVKVKVTVFSGEQYDGGGWPTPEYGTPLVDAIKWFQSKLQKIPEKFRTEAQCCITSSGGYEGDHYGSIAIWYYRTETRTEKAARIKEATDKANRKRAEELDALAALKAKYPEGA